MYAFDWYLKFIDIQFDIMNKNTFLQYIYKLFKQNNNKIEKKNLNLCMSINSLVEKRSTALFLKKTLNIYD